MTGVDANQEMTPYALEAAAIAGLPADRLRLVTGDAQALPLEDDSFDLVVCTLVSSAMAHESSFSALQSDLLQLCAAPPAVQGAPLSSCGRPLAPTP